MAIKLIQYPHRQGNVPLRLATGHFATSHSHLNYYIDMTMTKHRLSEARDAAVMLCSKFNASTIIDTILCLARNNKVDYAVVYGEFMYKAGPWPYERRVVCKVEKPENQMVYMYTFVVTNMDSSPEYLIKFYCKRGLMENFIKESKSGFDFASVSSHTRMVNANRLQVHALAYNIFNWFRRLALSANMRKQRIDTVRLKLLKIAAKVIRSARYITFKLCSSCPYKNEFYETLSNIGKLNVQLE